MLTINITFTFLLFDFDYFVHFWFCYHRCPAKMCSFIVLFILVRIRIAGPGSRSVSVKMIPYFVDLRRLMSSKCCGSGMFIPDPDFLSRIQGEKGLGSRGLYFLTHTTVPGPVFHPGSSVRGFRIPRFGSAPK